MILGASCAVTSRLAVHPAVAQEAGTPGAEGWLRENSYAALRLILEPCDVHHASRLEFTVEDSRSCDLL